jgi:hypothetical protein
MVKKRFHTDLRLWLITSGCLYLALGFVDPWAGATWKGEGNLWAHVLILVTGHYICSTSALAIPILFYSAFWAIPALVFGWVVHAFVVMVRYSHQSLKSVSDNAVGN